MKRHVYQIIVGALVLVVLFVGFNNCSEVNFQSGSQAVQGASDCKVGQSCEIKCEGNQCPNPNDSFQKHNYEVPYSLGAVDILFVIDNSGSMKKELENLGSKFQQLSAALADKDWQACYTTTDWENERGNLRKWEGQDYILTANTPNFANVFKATLDHITSLTSSTPSYYEHGIYSAYEAFGRAGTPAAKGCFRSGSAKAVVIVSDEDELGDGWTTPGGEQPQYGNKPENLIKRVHDKFGADARFSAHAVAIRPGDSVCLDKQRNESGTYEKTYGFEAVRYTELVTAAKGEFVSICESDYSGPLKKMGEKIVQSLTGVDLPCSQSATVSKVEVISNTPTIRSFSVSGKRVTFQPILVSGEKAIVHYKCLN